MFPQVNRAFRGLVQASPSIQHEVDLFGAGLKRNPRAKMSLADSRVALETYRSRWETLEPAVKWSKDLGSPDYQAVSVVSGTLGILWKDSAKFVTLGLVLRPSDSDMDSFELPWNIDFIRFSNCGNGSLVYCPDATNPRHLVTTELKLN